MFTFEKLGDGLIYYKNIIEDPYKIIEDIESMNARVENDLKNKFNNFERSNIL